MVQGEAFPIVDWDHNKIGQIPWSHAAFGCTERGFLSPMWRDSARLHEDYVKQRGFRCGAAHFSSFTAGVERRSWPG